MQEQRVKLPVWDKKHNILDALEKNQVLVISGMTGYVGNYDMLCYRLCWSVRKAFYGEMCV